MAKKKRERRERRDSNKRIRKKVSLLDQEGVEWVDYKDVDLLKRFMSDRAKIRARRVTGNDTQQQKAVARAIKLARELALLPYTQRVATSARGKRRRRDDDDDRDERSERRERRERDDTGDGYQGGDDTAPSSDDTAPSSDDSESAAETSANGDDTASGGDDTAADTNGDDSDGEEE